MVDRVEALIAQLTIEEQAALTVGVDMWHAAGVERLGITGIKVTDGPNGARGAFFVGTSSACAPCGTALGATWNTELVAEVGRVLGEETRAKHCQLLLAPTINIHRSPLAGRNFECYSEDPYLTARLAVAYIEGVQSTGVGCAVKHFVANDSEFERHTISSEVDEQTLREIYLAPFEAAATEARSASIMAAYNRLNGTYCAEHPELMRILFDEWGFDGFVISDWYGVKSTIGTGLAGCDLEMPGPGVHLGEKLAQAVHDGELPAEAVTAKARRLLHSYERLRVSERDVDGIEASEDRPEHRDVLRRAARRSHRGAAQPRCHAAHRAVVGQTAPGGRTQCGRSDRPGRRLGGGHAAPRRDGARRSTRPLRTRRRRGHLRSGLRRIAHRCAARSSPLRRGWDLRRVLRRARARG